jgi:hypothetical protein
MEEINKASEACLAENRVFQDLKYFLVFSKCFLNRAVLETDGFHIATQLDLTLEYGGR